MLYDPLAFGPLKLKNRLVMPPMHTGFTENGSVGDELVEYYRARAVHAAPGLIITEHSCITEGGRAHPTQLSLADDSAIAGHRRITDAVHEAGSLVMAQLNHAGSAARPSDGSTPVSASDLPNPRLAGSRPRPLSAEEIAGLEDRFAEAALRALAAGYDAVEIHSAHGYLLNQFYSPLTNRRQDAYGPANVDSRCRFLLETVRKVRDAVGARVPLAVRLGGSDYQMGGSTEEDAVTACVLLEQAGVDLLDLSGGMCGFVLPDRGWPGYFDTMTAKIRSAVSVPVLLTGGVTRPAEAERLLLDGKADLIGVGRALFKDPHWGETD